MLTLLLSLLAEVSSCKTSSIRKPHVQSSAERSVSDSGLLCIWLKLCGSQTTMDLCAKLLLHREPCTSHGSWRTVCRSSFANLYCILSRDIAGSGASFC